MSDESGVLKGVFEKSVGAQHERMTKRWTKKRKTEVDDKQEQPKLVSIHTCFERSLYTCRRQL